VRANAGVLFWLLALLVVTIAHRFIPASTWLMVHLLLLGAVSNAILVWSSHFSDAVLRATPRPYAAAGQAARLVLLNIGVAAVLAGMVTSVWLAVLAGGVLVGLAVIWHGLALFRRMRRALPSRFRPTVRYYLAAAALLPVGAAAGIVLARHTDHDRLLLSHVAINLLGWVGLTVVGTLVTLWPTMLRTRVVDGAERAAGRALWTLLGAVVVTAAAALLAPPPVAAIGIACYLGGLAIAAIPLVREARAKPPAGYATYSVLAGCGWLAVGLVWLAVVLLASPGWADVAARIPLLAGPLAAGFAAQVLLGALSYLVPVVAGGGPVAVRAATAELDRGAAWRVALINGALAVWVLPVPSLVAVITSVLVLVGLTSFLPLLAVSLRASFRARQESGVRPGLAERRSAADAVAAERRRPGRFAGPAVAAFAAIVLAVAGAVAVEPASVGAAPVLSAGGGIAGTGHTTTVDVIADHMRFTPQDISVPAGDRLLLRVTNTDTMVHDLVLDTGATSGRLAPGASAAVDAGIVGRDISGWCSIIGHRQLGMVMRITVTGMPSATTAGPDSPTSPAMPGMSGMQHQNMTSPAAPGAATPSLDFAATPPPGFRAHDATLPPIGPGRVHHVTLTVRAVDVPVAPGVRQTLWTYGESDAGGAMPGPTLHGRVGDTFVVHLVNDGDMGHSVDFHAGELAPDGPMRTINPGESLDYTFTATRSGIWLYHCSTMPMSAHIANGMFGAVVIDPPDLAPVDRQYVLISSELYLGPQDGSVDMDKIDARTPDAVVFNGYVNGYDADPLTAVAGERIRIWVLNAGPDEPVAFHVVGSQFDTVFREGAYLLRPGNAEHGGSQVLSLQPAEGGFVELVPPQPGRYPFVSHIMWAAEHGEHGILSVSASPTG
jgi:nitrite reductase (NO-forming)